MHPVVVCGDIKDFVITEESGIAKGIRRIIAVTGHEAAAANKAAEEMSSKLDAIEKMDGIGGKPGWAWIFILEGLFTVVCAVASFFILSDFPDTAKFLSENERKFFTSSTLPVAVAL